MEEPLPPGDARILESPLEASLELADLTGRRLPGIKKRSLHLLLMGIAWSASVMALTVLSGLYLFDLYFEGELLMTMQAAVFLSLTLLFIPSMGLGLALVILTFKERQFLPFIEKASGAMVAIGTPDAQGNDTQAVNAGPGTDRPLEGILGSAMWAGKLVPTVERMAAVARAVLVVLLLGLAYLFVLVAAGLMFGTLTIILPALELAVLAAFPGPALLLFKRLSRDVEFYRYYSRRHRAISEAAAVGPPPVPEGERPLERFESYLRSTPQVKKLLASAGARVEDGPAGPDPPFSRIYTGKVEGASTGILVRLFPEMPGSGELDRFLGEARAAAEKRGVALSRAVALVTADADKLDDSTYEHLLEVGRNTKPGECALQMVLEVDGAYSMVPFVAG